MSRGSCIYDEIVGSMLNMRYARIMYGCMDDYG